MNSRSSTRTKSMIALAMVGAVLVGSTTSSYARTAHKRHYRSDAYGPYALQPGSTYRSPSVYGRDPWWQPPRNYPNPYERPFLSWDPYGLRWDNAE